MDHTDLNRRVAAAVGWVSDEHNPARDWHDAMIAAERFGLFDVCRHERILLRVGPRDAPKWVVAQDDGYPAGFEYDAEHEHGPTCISLAVVRIAEGKRETD